MMLELSADPVQSQIIVEDSQGEQPGESIWSHTHISGLLNIDDQD